MKRIVINIIGVYKQFMSPLLHQLLGVSSGCRFEISCSEYTKQKIQTHGIGRGLWLGVKRLSSCNAIFSV